MRFNPETVGVLESGCSISVATVGPDGAPYATRGFGLTVLDDDHVRLFLDADDHLVLTHLKGGGPIAVTGVDVATLRAVQIKGTAGEPAATLDREDLERAGRHIESFFHNVSRMEGTPVALLERLRPRAFAVCTVAVTDAFDQTPGPGAGASLEPAP